MPWEINIWEQEKVSSLFLLLIMPNRSKTLVRTESRSNELKMQKKCPWFVSTSFLFQKHIPLHLNAWILEEFSGLIYLIRILHYYYYYYYYYFNLILGILVNWNLLNDLFILYYNIMLHLAVCFVLRFWIILIFYAHINSLKNFLRDCVGHFFVALDIRT